MKRMMSLLMSVVISLGLMTPTFAASDEATKAADTLYSLGLFSGTGTNADGTPIYDLDRAPTRQEAITMLVAMLGKTADARNGNWNIPFTDVADWAKPFVGYAYANGLTSGTSATTYGGNQLITASQYLTFVLTALGYKNGIDFQWDKAWELSDVLGLTTGEYSTCTTSFQRSDIAQISFNALSAAQKDSGQTLAQKLISDGVFVKEQYDRAIKNESETINDEHKIVPLKYSFVRIDGRLYEIVYSYELKRSESNRIYYAENEPSILYLDSLEADSMWTNTITRSLLTKTYKTAASDNPFVDRAIDMFVTHYDSSTISIKKEKQYLNATESYYTSHHSYRGKTLDIPLDVNDNLGSTVTTIDGIRYCGRYINLEDYCRFFSLDVSVAVEFDEELNQKILVIDY